MKRWLPATRSGWTWAQLARVTGALLGGELLLIFSLSRPVLPLPAEPGFTSGLVWYTEELEDSVSQWLPDPVVFARVVSQGFSGPLWVSGEVVESGKKEPAPPGVRTSAKSPPPLRPNLNDAWATSPGELGGVMVLPWFTPEPLIGAFREPARAGAGQSQLRVGEGLLGWRAIFMGAPPAWTNAQLLAPTVVQVLVDAQGGVLSATLELPGSGLGLADQEALRFARQIRFVPPPDSRTAKSPQWGRLEFIWHTVLPPLESPSPQP